MSRVLVLVEGPTERAVVERFLNPHLSEREVYLSPKVVGKPGHKGGVRAFGVVLREVSALLRQENQSTVTIMFDYYGLPGDWPGVTEAKGRSIAEKTRLIENGIRDAVIAEFGSSFRRDRFLPYIQMHELEALLFSNPAGMASVFGDDSLTDTFHTIVRECGGCESIDDNLETTPSKRIKSHFPPYVKGCGVNAHAPLILTRTGIDRVREQCPHFNEWLGNLERC